MSHYNYDSTNYIPRRTKALIDEFEAKVCLKDLLKTDNEHLTREKIIRAYCNDVEKVLSEDSIALLIDALFAVSTQLKKLNDEFEVGSDLPTFDSVYLTLSPILLRSLRENLSAINKSDAIIDGWKDAIRIVLEEELYFWKDRVKQ